jgi:hypothetical protein
LGPQAADDLLAALKGARAEMEKTYPNEGALGACIKNLFPLQGTGVEIKIPERPKDQPPSAWVQALKECREGPKKSRAQIELIRQKERTQIVEASKIVEGISDQKVKELEGEFYKVTRSTSKPGKTQRSLPQQK